MITHKRGKRRMFHNPKKMKAEALKFHMWNDDDNDFCGIGKVIHLYQLYEIWYN